MVHGDDEVEAGAAVGLGDGVAEDGVGGEGTPGVDAVAGGDLDGGGDDAGFFVAEEAALAGVGVQAADGDAGALDSEPAAGVVSEVDGVEDPADGEDIAHLHEGEVGGGEDDAEVLADEHHGVAFDGEAGGEQVGVAGVLGPAREGPGLFGDRAGDDRVGVEWVGGGELGGGDGVLDEAEGELAGAFVVGAGGLVVGVGGFVVDEGDIVREGGVDEFGAVGDAPPEGLDGGVVCGGVEAAARAEDAPAGEVAELTVGEGLDGDLGADAAGVAEGDGDGGAGCGIVVDHGGL